MNWLLTTILKDQPITTDQLWHDIQVLRRSDSPLADVPADLPALRKELAAMVSRGEIRHGLAGWSYLPQPAVRAYDTTQPTQKELF